MVLNHWREHNETCRKKINRMYPNTTPKGVKHHLWPSQKYQTLNSFCSKSGIELINSNSFWIDQAVIQLSRDVLCFSLHEQSVPHWGDPGREGGGRGQASRGGGAQEEGLTEETQEAEDDDEGLRGTLGLTFMRETGTLIKVCVHLLLCWLLINRGFQWLCYTLAVLVSMLFL